MIAIIEGCGNNVASLQFALERLGVDSQLTADPEVIKQASHVILPGVGHAQYAMQKLNACGLVEVIRNLKQPVLGICLGMQLLYEASAESDLPCLGIIPGKIQRLPQKLGYSIPHMGWNNLNITSTTSLANKSYVYFVHSYAAPITAHTVAVTHYTAAFTAMVHYRNFIGMQFHPERSGAAGEKLLMNFIRSSPLDSSCLMHTSYILK